MRPATDLSGALRRRATDVVLAAILVAATALQVCPGAQALLEFDRAGIAAGQYWRLATCNVVHFGWAQLLADAGAMAVLWWVCRRRGVPAGWPVAMSLMAVGPAVWAWGGVDVYRGLSGINCALVASALADAALRTHGQGGAGWWALLALLGARSVYELITGRGIGPTSLPSDVGLAGAAHLVGLAVGAAPAVVRRLARRGRTVRGTNAVLPAITGNGL
ncbi:MAG TPA: rhomboid family intramembrane serine protease [Phycisphaerae bacterium]|nr:rhomboid family intramembrane serine protease [Phycisphaerae bacterium]